MMENYEYVTKYKVIYRRNHSEEIGSFDTEKEAYEFIDERCKVWNVDRSYFEVMTIPCLKNPQDFYRDIPIAKINLNGFLRKV